MKTRLATVFAVVLTCLIVSGMRADQQPSKRIMTYIAVMDIRCGKGVDNDLVVPLTNIVIEELVRMKEYTVIDRANRDKILGEAGFQMTGCADSSCTIQIGKILGVGKIVVGTVDKIGETYRVSLQRINVETAAIENMSSTMCKKCEVDNLIETVASAAVKLMGEEPAAQPPPSAQPPSTPPVSPPVTQPPATAPVVAGKDGDMIMIPAGAFMMGCNEELDKQCEANEKPFHKVNLSDFSIDKFEVTVDQYQKCINAGLCSQPAKFTVSGTCNWVKSGRENHPINCVDWVQAKNYCEWAGKRLPTEAEWEKAARGTDGRRFPWGNEEPNCSFAVMDSNGSGCGTGATMPVGSKERGASPYGVMDMAGNVWEWTSDHYEENYYTNSPLNNPQGPASGSFRVLRGGGYPYKAFDLRASRRHWAAPEQGSARRGIRCAKTK